MKIVNTIKEIASNVIANGEPMEVIVGEVVSESPLAIKIDPKLTVPEENIILTKNTCEWTMEMSVDHVTENRIIPKDENVALGYHRSLNVYNLCSFPRMVVCIPLSE